MKNVTISNGKIASRAITTALVLGFLGYFGVKMDEVGKDALAVAVKTSAPPPATIFVPHHMRGAYYTGDCEKTAAHEVYIGMPEAQILCQTGEPETVNRSQNPYGSSAQYVFDGTTDRWYLYVTNGKVSSWQESWTR